MVRSIEMIRGFHALHFIGPCITVFGSARFKEDHPYYELTRNACAAFARLGFTLLTDGGPGLMEAANIGAEDTNLFLITDNIGSFNYGNEY